MALQVGTVGWHSRAALQGGIRSKRKAAAKAGRKSKAPRNQTWREAVAHPPAVGARQPDSSDEERAPAVGGRPPDSSDEE